MKTPFGMEVDWWNRKAGAKYNTKALENMKVDRAKIPEDIKPEFLEEDLKTLKVPGNRIQEIKWRKALANNRVWPQSKFVTANQCLLDICE